MATGDDATAAGYDLVASTDDRRDGWNEINKSRDYIAQLKTSTDTSLGGKASTSHTHPSADITDATEVATPNTLVKRAASGTFLVITPTADAHVASKGYVDAATGSADGPTPTAYARSATGSGWYQVWMNSAYQFMRNTSSRRYKKKIKTLTGALDKVMQLRPVTYEARDRTTPGTHIGLIAEEVFTVYPEIVPLEDGRPEAVNYEFLVAPLIAAMQEQQHQIEQLEAKVAALTNP